MTKRVIQNLDGQSAIRWRWGVLAAVAMTVVALYPQINLWLARGESWQGSFVVTQGDEIAYAAYVNALIDGRPRKNDPFTGHDALPGKHAPESLFSIQFVPAYAIALPAAVLRLSTANAFIILLIVGAITASLAIFWLLTTLSGDSRLAAGGALFILCFGTLVGSDCCWRPNVFTDMLPFLRRYQPSVAFPLFFVFASSLWHSLTCESPKVRLIYSVVAGALFSLLVFSYFYLWTAAIIWFGCVVLLWILFQRDQWRLLIMPSAAVGIFAVGALIPFLILLSRRQSAMDQSHLLEFTHAPDILNQPQMLGLVAIAALGYGSRKKMFQLNTPLVLFTASFAILPIALFNQQVITGISLQPIHYRVFIANYVALLAIVLSFAIIWRARLGARQIPLRLLVLMTMLSLGWGVKEVTDAVERNAPRTWLRDEVREVTNTLTKLAREDGSLAAAFVGNSPYPTVFTPALDPTLEAFMAIPSDSPLAILWSLHTDAVSMSATESKRRFYLHMYYSKVSPKQVAAGISQKQFWITVPLFGIERFVEGLTGERRLISAYELHEERRRYAEFYNNFSPEDASQPKLHFVVLSSRTRTNLANLDKWYERDAGQTVGAFTIYRLKLRSKLRAHNLRTFFHQPTLGSSDFAWSKQQTEV